MNGQMGMIYFYQNRNSGPASYDNPGMVYVKTPDLTCPTPANAFILCDESMYTLNDGYLQVDTHGGSFPDVPAAYLDGACGFGFADGHADLHRWQTTALTIVPYKAGVTGSYPAVPGGLRNVDWIWFAQHTACDHP